MDSVKSFAEWLYNDSEGDMEEREGFWPLDEPLDQTQATQLAKALRASGKSLAFSAAKAVIITPVPRNAGGSTTAKNIDSRNEQQKSQALESYYATLHTLALISPRISNTAEILEVADLIVLLRIETLARSSNNYELLKRLRQETVKTTDDFVNQKLLTLIRPSRRSAVKGSIRAKQDFIKVLENLYS